VLQRSAAAPIARPAPQPETAPPLIQKAANPSSRMRRLLFNKKTIIALGVVGCLVVGVAVRNSSSDNSNATAKKPSYQTVLPQGKTINELGGWKRVSPPKSDPVFAYTDTVDGVAISVTEQPLPQSFKSDTDSQVSELAKKFNATDKIPSGDLTVYIGTSAKGPQSVIFANNSLLILIKSEKKISDASWAKYAQTLN
jgi:hypothetical protein